ncbi:MAG: Yip1 family protein, partial [Planctomycetota bacterium]
MRCRTCNYRLWNLESRRCPECGSPFLPSDFDFAPGSVQFCCPHCKQAYYATDPEGHLVPRDFDCVQCGNHIAMDEMILLPTEGLEEEQTDAPYHPWLDRRKVGRFKGWLSTIWLAMTGPGRLVQLAPKERSTGQAWWFALITNMLAMLAGFGPFLLIPFVFSMGGGPQIGFWRVVGALPKFGLVAVILVCAGLLVIVVWGLLSHGLLRLTGPTSGPLSRTYEAICYSSGANIATGVPCLGYYFGWIWWCISAVFTLRATHKVSGGRAALAALLPPGLLVASVFALYAYFLFNVISSTGSFA